MQKKKYGDDDDDREARGEGGLGIGRGVFGGAKLGIPQRNNIALCRIFGTTCEMTAQMAFPYRESKRECLTSGGGKGVGACSQRICE